MNYFIVITLIGVAIIGALLIVTLHIVQKLHAALLNSAELAQQATEIAAQMRGLNASVFMINRRIQPDREDKDSCNNPHT